MSITESEFAPRRQRIERPLPQTPRLVVDPVDEDVSANAHRVATMVGNLQASERKVRAENAELKARNEQQEVKISEQRSDIESLRDEVATERAERIRLGAGLEQLAHTIHKLNGQPDEDGHG